MYEYKYCSHCGKELILKEIGDEGIIPFCVECNKPYFRNPVCSVLVAVVNNNNNEVLLLKQNYVSATNWVLVAGYLKVSESLEKAVYREVLEETGLEISECKYINSYYYNNKEILMIGFVAYTNNHNFNLNSKEVDNIKWETFSNALSSLRNGSTGQKHLINVIGYLGLDKSKNT